MDIGSIEQEIKQIELKANQDNQLVTCIHLPQRFEVVGFGTDAVVVKEVMDTQKVWKVFAPGKIKIKEKEYEVYQRLGSSEFFANCYEEGENYLCLSYESGPTLYQCLEEGIVIPEQVIWDVDTACRYAQRQGLNPRDIHLKNVLLQEGRAKLIDISEYSTPGNDHRWNDLVQGYYHMYHLIRGKKIPPWVIELVKNAYANRSTDSFTVVEFCQSIIQMLGLTKKD